MAAFDRRGMLAATALGAALGAAPAWSIAPPRDIGFAQDFDELWRTLAERYCYFDEKATDWARVRALYRPRAAAAPSPEAFARVIERALAELYDAHTHLADPPDGTPRFPPFDLLVTPTAGGARVVAVREASAAALAGLRAGALVTHVDDAPVARVAAALAPRCLARRDAAAEAYACNVAVAGRRGQPRRLTVDGRGVVALPLLGGVDAPALQWRRLDAGFGLIRIASFADLATIDAFDAALGALRDAPGLLIDVRDNGGGDTAVARPMMGRFVAATAPYARMRRRDGAGLSGFWTETVTPRGPRWTRPVVVLCNHWSASMAEGFPMGMRALCGARIVGTPMMGLGAAVFRLRLDRSGIEAQYSAEPVHDLAGRPRATLRPDVEVAAGGDILAASVRELRRLTG